MRRIASPALLATALMTAPVAALAQVTVDTAQGPVTLQDNPDSVAVYDMAALDTITALGVTPKGSIDNILVPALRDAAAGATPVGTLFEPDLEALAGLAPDLVIVGGRSSTQLAAVSQVAPAIDMTFGPDLLADARARIDAYGALFAKTAQAEEMTATLDSRLADLRAAADGQGTALIVMTNGPKLAAYGTGSRFGWLHDQTGLTPAIADLKADEGHGNVLTHEAIAQANPD